MDHIVAEPETLYVGTPAYLIVTENPDGSANLSPASSYWALGRMLVLGLENESQTTQNLLERGDITVNFPSGDLWRAVLRLDGTTGRYPVPDVKLPRYEHVADKFGRAGLTPEPSDLVSVPRVAECALQFEARVRRATPGITGGYVMVEAEVVRVHAAPDILKPGTLLPDPERWSPLVYLFRHFFQTGTQLGWLPKSPTAVAAPPLS